MKPFSTESSLFLWILVASLPQVSFGSVRVEVTVESWRTAASDRNELADGIRSSLLAGDWDEEAVSLPVLLPRGNAVLDETDLVREAGRTLLKLTSHSFSKLPAQAQQQVVGQLLSYYAATPTYQAVVDTRSQNIGAEPIIRALGIDPSKLPARVPAEKLLSPFAQTWAYQTSVSEGPNCWHSSLASIFFNWKKARYMPPTEFTCQLGAYFTQIARPSQWGDVIRLVTKGVETHGFTFLGPNKNDPNDWIVFTKNGYLRSRYLFMSYSDVVKLYSPTHVGFYRAKYIALDPTETSSSACSSRSVEIERHGDPVILAGMRKKDPKTLEPIQLNGK